MTTTSLIDIRQRLDEALLRGRAERASPRPVLVRDAESGAEWSRLLELLLEGANGPITGLVSHEAVGYGSQVTIEDLATGERFQHRLMSVEAMDLDAGHVTIDSPLGSALLGAAAGDVVDIVMPDGRRRRLRVARVETLPAMLERLDADAQVGTRERSRGPERPYVVTGTDG